MPNHGIWDQDLSAMGLDSNFFKGKVVLLVNTASHCGYTPQLAELQSLQQRWQFADFTVLAIPSTDFGGQEFTAHDDVCEFYQTQYQATFPIAFTTSVPGNPLHEYIAARGFNMPAWNFHKYVIDRSGQPRDSLRSDISPNSEMLMLSISKLLAEDPPE